MGWNRRIRRLTEPTDYWKSVKKTWWIWVVIALVITVILEGFDAVVPIFILLLVLVTLWLAIRWLTGKDASE